MNPIPPVYWVGVYNTTNDVIPPGGLMLITGVTGGIAQVTKPTADNQTDLIIVNSHTPIPAQSYGTGRAGVPSAVVAYVPDPRNNSIPSVGQAWGVKAGSWYLNRVDNSNALLAGFVILGGAGKGLVNAAIQIRGVLPPPDAGAGQSVTVITGLGPCVANVVQYTTATLSAVTVIGGLNYPDFLTL